MEHNLDVSKETYDHFTKTCLEASKLTKQVTSSTFFR